MVFVVRIDLRYVPWDSDRAALWGHREPAMIVRLLELARRQGYVFHFFATEPVVRAFPTLIPTILNEGHAFGWLKHGEGNEEGMEQICKLNGHKLEFIANDQEVLSISGGQTLCCGQSLEKAAIADQPWGHWQADISTSSGQQPLVLWISPSGLWRLDPSLINLTKLVDRLLTAGGLMRTFANLDAL